MYGRRVAAASKNTGQEQAMGSSALRVLRSGAVLLTSVVVACGDGGGGKRSTPAPTPSPTAPPSVARLHLPSGQPVAIREDVEPDSVTAADDPVPPTLYTQFPDDELNWWTFSVDQFSSTVSYGDEIVGVGPLPVSLPTPVLSSNGQGSNTRYTDNVEFAAGRMVSNDADQLVTMTKTGLDPEDDCYYVDYTVQGFLNPAVGPAAFPPYALRACLAARDRWQDTPFAIAAGDLDWVVDAAGDFHDEVVFVSESGNAGLNPPGGVTVTVLDYAAAPGQVTPTSFTLPWNNQNAANGLAYPLTEDGQTHPGQVRVVVFNPQLTLNVRQEMIATLHTGPQGNVLNVLEYTTPDPESSTAGSLALVATQVLPSVAVSAPIDLAAGDFDDDGHEELAVLSLYDTGVAPTGQQTSTYGLRLAVYRLGQATFTLLGQTDLDANLIQPHCAEGCLGSGPGVVDYNVRVVSGLFTFEPGTAQTLTRRQIAVAYPTVEAASFPVHSIFGCLQIRILSYDSGSLSFGSSFQLEGQGLQGTGSVTLTAGNFSGASASPPNPVWSLAWGVVSPGLYAAAGTWQPENGIVTQLPLTTQELFDFQHQRMLAFDYDGDSLYLGAPVVFTASGVQQPLAVLQQPPQHLDYRPNADGASSDTGIVNVSRYPEQFKLTFSQGQDAEIQSSGSTTASGTLGTSSAFSAGGSLKRGIPFLGKWTVSGSYSSLTNFVRENSQTNSAGQATSIDLNASVSPGADDAVQMLTQDWRIWRYRLYGAQGTDPNNPNLFYEVEAPLPAENGWYPGLNVEPYQPLHENGNLFSYPEVSAVLTDPADLGGWQPPLLPPQCSMAPPQGYQETALLTPGGSTNVFSFGAVPQTWEITIDNSTTCGNEREASKTISDESEWETALMTKTKIPFVAKVETDTSYQNSASNESSWSTLATTDSTYSVSQQIEIEQSVTADNFFSYQFAPAVYFGQAGNLRLRFGADPLAGTIWNSRDVSRGGYGFPDPALNLPYKFVTPAGDPEEVTFNFSLSGSRIRGFFLRDGTPDVVDGASGLGPVLAAPPTYGDLVQLEARVYNYSFTNSVGPIPVRFDIADYDSCSEETSNRRVLGTVTAQFTDELNTPDGQSQGTTFPARGIGRAVYTLDTSTLPATPDQVICDELASAGPAHEYAIFVVIDPEGTLAAQGEVENHGWRDTSVLAVPFTNLASGDLVLEVFTDTGESVGKVVVESQGNTGKDIECLAAAFENPSECPQIKQDGVAVAQTYSLTAEAVPPFVAGVSDPQFLRLRADQPLVLPPSDDFDATLAFENPVAGASSLHFVGSVENPGTGTVPSLYTTDLQLGQNNEGVGYLAVLEPAPSSAANDLFFKTDSLGLIDRARAYQTERGVVRLGQPAPVRICGHSREPYRGRVSISLSLGDPKHGGTPLAVKQLHGIRGDQGTCTWFHWMPTQVGDFVLRAELDEDRDDARPTNNVVELAVQVVGE